MLLGIFSYRQWLLHRFHSFLKGRLTQHALLLLHNRLGHFLLNWLRRLNKCVLLNN
ncbi:hypothetical protein WZ342_2588 [Enterococcus faecalis]|nr:hypothetical protein WZ342_2588 [Enterococcus faecalis]